MFNLKLKTRLILAFTLVGFCVSFLFAAGFEYALETTEEQILYNDLASGSILLAEHYDKFPVLFKTEGKIKNIYRTPAGTVHDFPEEYRHVENIEEYETGVNDEEFIIVKVKQKNYDYLFVYTIAEFEKFETTVEWVINIGVVICTLISIWLGFIISNGIIKPITTLSSTLKNYDGNQKLPHIPDVYADDEVGFLASQFRQYNRAIEQYIEREQSFTSDASHELRTPITIINGASELLLDVNTLSEKDRNIVQRIRSASIVMHELVDAFLLLARNPSEFAKTENSFSVNAVIEKQIESMRNLYSARLRTLDIVFQPAKNVTINGPERALSIIIRNILRNAFTHTAQGEIKITLEETQLSISDTGSGISDAIKDKVFERYFSGEQNKQTTAGTGIGLSLVKRLCELSGWTVQLESKENNGTNVIVIWG